MRIGTTDITQTQNKDKTLEKWKQLLNIFYNWNKKKMIKKKKKQWNNRKEPFSECQYMKSKIEQLQAIYESPKANYMISIQR